MFERFGANNITRAALMENSVVKKAPILRRVVCAALLVMIGYCGLHVHRTEVQRSAMKADLKEISHISYGLFNVDQWRSILAEIVSKKIRALEITPQNRGQLKAEIEGLMYKMIAQVESVVKTNNKKSGLKGLLRKTFLDLFVDINAIKAGVPKYADQVLDYLNDPKNREELRDVVLSQFNTMADRTMARMDYTLFNSILAKYGCTDKQQCIDRLNDRTGALGRNGVMYFSGLLAAVMVLVALFLFGGQLDRFELVIMVAAAFCLLVSGLSLPMIDIEATISSFSFQLLGEPVVFKDQILFYQSKSIIEVVRVLLSDHDDVGLIAVGCLILSFSVVIPFAKLTTSLITVLRGKVPRGAVPRFLVFKASKWSMADVLVVAIFMSYIGFSGIISNQLDQLESYGSSIQLLTTNLSQLQLGFYLFLTYCVMGLLLSVLIERNLKARGIAAIAPAPALVQA